MEEKFSQGLEGKLSGFDFDSKVVFYREIPGSKMLGQKVKAVLEVDKNPKGDYIFKVNFRYADTNKPVVPKKNSNFSTDHHINFSVQGLKSYINRNDLELTLPQEYFDLLSKRNAIINDAKKFYQNTASQNIKNKKKKEVRILTDKLDKKMNSIYTECTLKQFGEGFVEDLYPKLKTFIETDGRPISYGGNGCGPYLQNFLSASKIPDAKKPLPRTYSGCFGTGKRK